MRRTLVAVVIAVALFSCRYESQRHAREVALRDDLFEMRKAIDNFYADNHRYPASLDDLVRSRYLRRVPADPITENARTWIQVKSADGGVVDVKSGAIGKSRDGTRYRDW